MWWRDLVERLLTREVLTFLAVGGAGYAVDVAAFNLLRCIEPFASLDPSAARTVAVALAMCVTYLGNRTLTWQSLESSRQRRQVSLFIVFNIIALGFSTVTLVLTHDVLGLTSRLADNVSANVVGLALGTAFRYVTYKRFVFAAQPKRLVTRTSGGRSGADIPRMARPAGNRRSPTDLSDVASYRAPPRSAALEPRPPARLAPGP